jgi:hypothetical protein
MNASPGRAVDSGDPKQISSIASHDSMPAVCSQALTLDSPELFLNRELSLLEFQKRVLQEAQDSENPFAGEGQVSFDRQLQFR